MKKSQIFGFFLTFFFGPIGLFYSSVPAALGFIVAVIGLFAIAGPVGVFLLWPISILVGFSKISNYNGKVDLEEKHHREIVEAIKSGRHSD